MKLNLFVKLSIVFGLVSSMANVGPAVAARFRLSGVVFDNGATATGFFDFGGVSDSYSNIEIAIDEIGVAAPVFGNGITELSDQDIDISISDRQAPGQNLALRKDNSMVLSLNLFFRPNLTEITNIGQTVTLGGRTSPSPGCDTGETCIAAQSSPRNLSAFIESGSVTSIPITFVPNKSIPEPHTILGSALALGFGLLIKKRSKH